MRGNACTGSGGWVGSGRRDFGLAKQGRPSVWAILPRWRPYAWHMPIREGSQPMAATPARRSARDRLREAQQTEARALKEVDAAVKSRDRAATRLHDADCALARAQAAVVQTSGLDRAAYLLDVDRAELKRRVRDTEHADQEAQPAVSRTESSTASQA